MDVLPHRTYYRDFVKRLPSYLLLLDTGSGSFHRTVPPQLTLCPIEKKLTIPHRYFFCYTLVRPAQILWEHRILGQKRGGEIRGLSWNTRQKRTSLFRSPDAYFRDIVSQIPFEVLYTGSGPQYNLLTGYGLSLSCYYVSEGFSSFNQPEQLIHIPSFRQALLFETAVQL
jgi:hypothetical protein